MRERFDPPIQLNRDVLPEFPPMIATRREAAWILEMLPTCGIHWCGVVGCLERSDVSTLRRALATALERYGFLSPFDVAAHRPLAVKENTMVSKWLGMREMQARRVREEAAAKVNAMADREQRGNREKRKPKK